jgi:hypothetical protein
MSIFMTVFPALLGGFIAFPSFGSERVTERATDRRAESVIAQKALLDLQFMFEGRGMVAPPNLPPYRLDSAFGRRTVHTLKDMLQEIESRNGLLARQSESRAARKRDALYQ